MQMKRILLIFGFVALATVMMPTLVVVIFLMLPSLIIYPFERLRPRYLTMTMAMLNFSGSLPPAILLWERGQSFSDISAVLFDGFHLGIAYLSAGCGIVIYYAVPSVMRIYLSSDTENEVEKLQKVQKDLIDVWGDEVRGQLPTPTESDESPVIVIEEKFQSKS